MPLTQAIRKMNKLFLLLIFIIEMTFSSCNGQKDTNTNKNSIDNYETEILPENEMRMTTDKAVKLIQSKNYEEVKNLFADDISKIFPLNKLHSLLTK